MAAEVRTSIRILIVNPNSSASMTRGVEQAIRRINLPSSTEIRFYTAPPESPCSINNDTELQCSYEVVYRSLMHPHDGNAPALTEYDGVLVACYSVHPLVERLAAEQRQRLAIIGIFEASILTAMALLNTQSLNTESPPKWGIVTTGHFWERHLTDGVNLFLGVKPHALNNRFAGVQSTGLDAGDFHGGVPPGTVRKRLHEATKRLLSLGALDCVVMGCVGMAGLEDVIRSAAIEQYGLEQGNQVAIIDGVKAGISMLEQMVRGKRMFQKL